MTDEACFDWTLLTNRRLEGLGVRERVVVRANDRLALKGAGDKSIEALDYAKKSGLVPSKSIPLLLSVLRGWRVKSSSLGMPRAARLISVQSSTLSLSRTTRFG